MKQLVKDKDIRQRAIHKIVGKSRIGSQDELLERLEAEGIATTQATLSRDLRQMNIVKMHGGEGGSYYSVPTDFMHVVPDTSSGHILSGIVGGEFSGQVGMLKTRPGYANVVGAVVDARLGGHVMGTIAGDDTLAIFLRTPADIPAVRKLLEEAIPGIGMKIID